MAERAQQPRQQVADRLLVVDHQDVAAQPALAVVRIGIDFTLTGGTQFVLNYLWLIALFAIAFFLVGRANMSNRAI